MILIGWFNKNRYQCIISLQMKVKFQNDPSPSPVKQTPTQKQKSGRQAATNWFQLDLNFGDTGFT